MLNIFNSVVTQLPDDEDGLKQFQLELPNENPEPANTVATSLYQYLQDEAFIGKTEPVHITIKWKNTIMLQCTYASMPKRNEF